MSYGDANIDRVVTSTPQGILGAGNASIMKNRIINGAMVIDQRNNGASVTPTTSNLYVVDRWSAQLTQASKFSLQQNAGSVTPPAGFTNYLGATSTSAYSLASGDVFGIQQAIEGFNAADLNWGSANAKPVTLSFWVRSSLTGTFGGALYAGGSTDSYPFSYIISSANTWTSISITIAAPTSGTFPTANGAGFYVNFGLGCGSTYSGTAGVWSSSTYRSATGATSVVGTSGATFYITGVQLEVGTSATGFEYRHYQQEDALCKRYYVQTSQYIGLPITADTLYQGAIMFPVTMRSTPTLQAGSTFTARAGNNGTPAISSGITGIVTTANGVSIYNSASNWTVNTQISFTGGFNAEL